MILNILSKITKSRSSRRFPEHFFLLIEKLDNCFSRRNTLFNNLHTRNPYHTALKNEDRTLYIKRTEWVLKEDSANLDKR